MTSIRTTTGGGNPEGSKRPLNGLSDLFDLGLSARIFKMDHSTRKTNRGHWKEAGRQGLLAERRLATCGVNHTILSLVKVLKPTTKESCKQSCIVESGIDFNMQTTRVLPKSVPREPPRSRRQPNSYQHCIDSRHEAAVRQSLLVGYLRRESHGCIIGQDSEANDKGVMQSLKAVLISTFFRQHANYSCAAEVCAARAATLAKAAKRPPTLHRLKA